MGCTTSIRIRISINMYNTFLSKYIRTLYIYKGRILCPLHGIIIIK